MTSLIPGEETNVGLIYRLLQEMPDISLYYEPGIQWRGWRKAPEIVAGVGINRQIRRAYTFLASRYSPGDHVYLVGYSRGAYAVRALAGMIDRLGLLKASCLRPENVIKIYRAYKDDPTRPEVRSFVAQTCHPKVEINAVCVFDTVSALGNRWPLFWRFAPQVHKFRSHRLGQSVKHGLHALALHEKRVAFAPELWEVPAHRVDEIEQVWFRGVHGAVGGQLGQHQRRRPLSNIPLVWMLSRMEAIGLALPADWRARFPRNPQLGPTGRIHGFGRLFVLRRWRKFGVDPSERLHVTVGATAPRAARGLPVVGDIMCIEGEG